MSSSISVGLQAMSVWSPELAVPVMVITGILPSEGEKETNKHVLRFC